MCSSLAEVALSHPMTMLNSGVFLGVLCVNVCMTKPQADRKGREVPVG